METSVRVKAEQATSWVRVVNMARRTAGSEYTEKEPTDRWKKRILLAEHSPIRMLEFDLTFEDIMQWVSVHLVRHHEGVEKFVHSQRSDRRELSVPRSELPQGELNDMAYVCNAQALISVSRKRLCACASPETRDAWKKAKEAIRLIDPVVASKMVRECTYRGFCPEMKSCGYACSKEYAKEVAEYRDVVETPRYVVNSKGQIIDIENITEA